MTVVAQASEPTVAGAKRRLGPEGVQEPTQVIKPSGGTDTDAPKVPDVLKPKQMKVGTPEHPQ